MPVVHVWKVKGYSTKHLENKKKSIKLQVKSLKEELKELEKTEGLPFEEEEGTDEDIKVALKGKIDHSVLENLHKSGIMITGNDLYNWEGSDFNKHRNRKPANKYKQIVLEAIKNSKSYKQ